MTEATIALLPLSRSNEPAMSRVLANGRQTEALVSGKILEAAFLVASNHLLFTIDDEPNEEVLHIHLLNQNFEALDSASIFALHGTGTLHNLKALSETRFRFRFFGNYDTELEVLGRPCFMLPMFGQLNGVFRKPKLRGWLKLSRYKST
jgi:hypothetical protein